MHIRTDTGAQLDSEMRVEYTGTTGHVVIESRGGADRSGGNRGRNPDYIPAFNLVLRRLASRGAVLLDAAVVSKRVRSLPREDRRLIVDGTPYPIRLENGTDVDALAVGLRAAAARVGRPAGAEGGGNPTKRVELSFRFPDAALWDQERLERLIREGRD